ncbi:MAG: 50S ribosomal protein L11 methyltransferase [Pseudohongiellaceae bacterium]
MWQELKFRVSSENALLVEEKLFSSGAAAVTFLDAKNQPIFVEETDQTPLWKDICIVSLFSQDVNLDPVVQTLVYGQPAINSDDIDIHLINDQDWESKWMNDQKPQQFGNRLWIYPSWITPLKNSVTNMILDPGLAFGTGSHPTTSLCLNWLDNNLIPSQHIIDYGCGSGILAIAAALLGASKVYAVDNDPQAITATLSNMEKNKISNQSIQTFSPEALPQVKVDLLIANILANPLIQLLEIFSTLIKPSGKIVLSGILEEQIEKVFYHYKSYFEFEEPQLNDGWALIAGSRKD